MGRGRGRGRAAGRTEHKITGLNAVRAVYDHRPDDIVRVYLTEGRIPVLSPLLKWCAANKRAYHVVEKAELDRVASSLHHEGVCALVRAKEPLTVEALLEDRRTSKRAEVILALDGVANPNNLGALTRSAAHFGSTIILYRPVDPEAGFSSALARVAEGGLEHVELLATPKLAPLLVKFRERGFVITSTSGRATQVLFETELPAKMLLLLGAEDHGVSKELEGLASLRLQIPGTGLVESLNVSAAGAIFLAEHRRQHPLPVPAKARRG